MARRSRRPDGSDQPADRLSSARHPAALVMLSRAVNDLDDIYRLLATPRSRQDLADDYGAALRQGGMSAAGTAPELARPIPLLATAIPPSATVSTAIHTLHALPKTVEAGLPGQLLEIARRNAVDALGCCHRALKLDGADHGYTVEEWLPTVYDIARPLLQSARLNVEPPSLVQVTQAAISWLSRAIAELDQRSEEVPTSVAQTLARLLAVWIFTDVALQDR